MPAQAWADRKRTGSVGAPAVAREVDDVLRRHYLFLNHRSPRGQSALLRLIGREVRATRLVRSPQGALSQRSLDQAFRATLKFYPRVGRLVGGALTPSPSHFFHLKIQYGTIAATAIAISAKVSP